MQQIIFGKLAGLEETSINLEMDRGQIRVYPRRELDVSLDWVFDNMGKRVICMLKDGVVTEVKASP